MRRVATYPFLMAMWLVLAHWRQGGEPAPHRLLDLGSSLLAAVGIAALGTLIGQGTARVSQARGLVALVIVAWSTLYSAFVMLAPLLGIRLAIGEGALVWLALGTIGVMVVRRLTVPDGLSRALTMSAWILVLIQVGGILTALWTAQRQEVVRGTNRAERSTAQPDIYLFVLDKYGASRWLAEQYGLDNRPFEDSLRAMGFDLPPASRTNYPHTGLVLASLLDGALVHETVNDSTARWPAVFARIQSGRMVSFLRAKGYRFVFFPTTFMATSHADSADVVMSPEGTKAVAALQTWRLHAPFDALLSLRCGLRGCRDLRGARAPIFPYPHETAEAISWKLEAVRTLPDSIGPVFALVHVLLPHEPYQVDASCRPVEPWWPQSDAMATRELDARLRAAYAAQVACANRLILRTVRAIVERSKIPPVILIQGDHGHGRLTEDAMSGRTVPLAALSAHQLRERLDVFAAYRVPGHDSIFPPAVTPVSVLPRVMNALFSAGLAVPDDRSWWVDAFNQPLRVVPLTEARLRLNTDAPPSP